MTAAAAQSILAPAIDRLRVGDLPGALPRDPAVLDNRAGAARRAPVLTASHSQVNEPLCRRSAGRWERYRQPLEPVLLVLAPWAARMGYAM